MPMRPAMSVMEETDVEPVSPHDASGPINLVAGGHVMLTVPNFYRLESSGALAPFEHRVRPEALGYRLGAYVTVQVVQRSLADVGAALAHIPEVLEVTALSGVADLLVRVVAVDADDLWRITEQVLAIPGVQRTDTALALRRFVDHRMTPLLERAAGVE